MHLEILVEEPSVEAALQELVPKIVGGEVSFNLITHQGKDALLKSLPNRLRGYRAWLPEGFRIVVLLDEDREDCFKLKARMEEAARRAGFTTASDPEASGRFTVLNRVAVEELEAWFLGDVPALRQVFPKIPESLGKRARFRDPDSVRGGTWEALERELQRLGYYSSGMPKIELARMVARHMEPNQNRSPSFKVFQEGLRRLVET
jgi:hypothetical protein